MSNESAWLCKEGTLVPDTKGILPESPIAGSGGIWGHFFLAYVKYMKQ